MGFSVVGVNLGHAILGSHGRGQLGPDLGQGQHLAIRVGGVVAKVGQLAHKAGADKTDACLARSQGRSIAAHNSAAVNHEHLPSDERGFIRG